MGEASAPEESCSVFVGGISFDADENDLREFFAECGNVVGVSMPVDRQTGRIKGFAFVDFDTHEAALKACELNEHEIKGRYVKVNLSTKDRSAASTPKKGKFMGGPSTPRDKPAGCTTVFIGNLPWSITEDSLYAAFEPCGPIKQVRIALDRETQQPKG